MLLLAGIVGNTERRQPREAKVLPAKTVETVARTFPMGRSHPVLVAQTPKLSRDRKKWDCGNHERAIKLGSGQFRAAYHNWSKLAATTRGGRCVDLPENPLETKVIAVKLAGLVASRLHCV